jgi:hypothetical protein
MAHLPAAHSRESSYQQHHCPKYQAYHQGNQFDQNDCRPDYRHRDNQRHNHPQCNNKDLKSSKSYEKKDDCKCNHFKKKSNRAYTMTSPLCQAWAIRPEEAVVLAQDLLHVLVLGLALAQAAGATTITMWLRMTASRAHSPSTGTCTPLRVMMAGVSITLTRAIPFLPPSLLQRQRKVSAPRNKKLRQQRIMCPIVCLHSR